MDWLEAEVCRRDDRGAKQSGRRLLYISGATDVKCNLDIAALDCETGAWNVDRLYLGDTLEDSRIVAYGKRPVAEPSPKFKYRLATFKIRSPLASGDRLFQSLYIISYNC